MRRCRVAVLAAMLVCAWGCVHIAAAQQGLTVGAAAIFYGDNTEFRNPFREGETIFGAAPRLDVGVELSDAVTLSIGVWGNQRFGSDSAFESVRPVLTLSVKGGRSRFLFGTIETPRAGVPAGPDRTGPHGLLPPLQRETLAFDRPYEAGLQWLFDGRRLRHDAWLHWQRINTPAARERLDGGIRGSWRLAGPLSLPVQAHIVHEGGQLFASGAVRDSVALATGLVLSAVHQHPGPPHPACRLQNCVTLELLGLWSHDTPDREFPERTRDGAGFFGRAALERRHWRLHLIAWRGDDFIKDEGDANYLSVRRDGTRYRGVRDYAETGITRTFRIAPDAVIEASFRFHRIERHYEYSYRVLAVARARGRIR